MFPWYTYPTLEVQTFLKHSKVADCSTCFPDVVLLDYIITLPHYWSYKVKNGKTKVLHWPRPTLTTQTTPGRQKKRKKKNKKKRTKEQKKKRKKKQQQTTNKAPRHRAKHKRSSTGLSPVPVLAVLEGRRTIGAGRHLGPLFGEEHHRRGAGAAGGIPGDGGSGGGRSGGGKGSGGSRRRGNEACGGGFADVHFGGQVPNGEVDGEEVDGGRADRGRRVEVALQGDHPVQPLLVGGTDAVQNRHCLQGTALAEEAEVLLVVGQRG